MSEVKIKGAVYLIGNQTDGLSAETEAGNGAVLDHGTEMTIGNAKALAFALNRYVIPPVHCSVLGTQYQTAVKGSRSYFFRHKQLK